jgi:hypothetical protein
MDFVDPGRELNPLCLQVFPPDTGSSGQFELYEDDGVSEAYLDGAFAVTTFSCTRTLDVVTVESSGAKGRYDGMLPSRTYCIQLRSEPRPERVVLNEVEVPVCDDTRDITTKSSWSFLSSNSTVQVVFEAPARTSWRIELR